MKYPSKCSVFLGGHYFSNASIWMRFDGKYVGDTRGCCSPGNIVGSRGTTLVCGVRPYSIRALNEQKFSSLNVKTCQISIPYNARGGSPLRNSSSHPCSLFYYGLESIKKCLLLFAVKIRRAVWANVRERNVAGEKDSASSRKGKWKATWAGLFGQSPDNQKKKQKQRRTFWMKSFGMLKSSALRCKE